MYASSKLSTHRHIAVQKSLSTLNDGESEGGTYRAHIRAHSRDVCMGKHHEHTERRTGETYAFTLDSDRARVSKLYSLFHAGKPRERLDQPAPAGRTRTEQRKEERERRKEKERKTVKRYLSHKLREKSMSTAVNYDKCRECDAAISRYHAVPTMPPRGPPLTSVVLPDLLWDACHTYKGLPIADLSRTQVTAAGTVYRTRGSREVTRTIERIARRDRGVRERWNR